MAAIRPSIRACRRRCCCWSVSSEPSRAGVPAAAIGSEISSLRTYPFSCGVSPQLSCGVSPQLGSDKGSWSGLSKSREGCAAACLAAARWRRAGQFRPPRFRAWNSAPRRLGRVDRFMRRRSRTTSAALTPARSPADVGGEELVGRMGDAGPIRAHEESQANVMDERRGKRLPAGSDGLFAGGGEILRLARTASRSSGFRMRGNLLALLPQLAMITASGRRRCCSTHLRDARSAPATSGSRGRAATATSERRCCRLPPPLMPTAACRLRPVRTTGSPCAGSLWTRACAG